MDSTPTNAIPVVPLDLDLTALAGAIGGWFSSISPLVWFIVAIPIAFYIVSLVKNTFASTK